MALRHVLFALALAVLPAAMSAMDAPTGVLAIPAGDQDEVPCGGAAVVVEMPGLGRMILTLEEALPGAGRGEKGAARLSSHIDLVLPGGRRGSATIVRRGAATGALLLHPDVMLDDSVTKPLELADSAQVHIGDTVWTAGNAFGALEQDGAAAISRGVISGLYAIPSGSPPVRGRGGRILSSYRGAVIEIDAAVNDGNHGGALLDGAGRLIGLVSLGTARERRLGTAVPIHVVMKDLECAPTLAEPAAERDPLERSLVRAAAAVAPAIALVYIERPAGLGNPEAMPRPTRLVDEVPAYDRERLQNWWSGYYHQQQMFYTDQPISALVIDAQSGLLLTAASNLHGEAEVGSVLVPGKAAIPCKVLARHLPLDLALLKADQPLPFPALALATDPHLALGEPIAVAARHIVDGGHTMTVGVVSATGRRRTRNDFAFTQTDAHVNYGSLGGAVVDAQGAVVGMVVMLGPDDGNWPWMINSGVGLFADSASIARVLPEMIAGRTTGSAPPIGLGVLLKRGLAKDGMEVESVTPGSGADKGGVKPGDIITALDGLPTRDIGAIGRGVMKHRTGERVALNVRRGGETVALSVVIGALAK